MIINLYIPAEDPFRDEVLSQVKIQVEWLKVLTIVVGSLGEEVLKRIIRCYKFLRSMKKYTMQLTI